MITSVEMVQRTNNALKALEAKRQSMTGSVINTSTLTEDGEFITSCLGNILITLSEGGNQIAEGSLTRSLATCILLLKHYDKPFTLDWVENMNIDNADIIYLSQIGKTHLLAEVAMYVSGVVEIPTFQALSTPITDAAMRIVEFSIMHGMNELELINDIPDDLSIRI